jgi:tellurite resistance protein
MPEFELDDIREFRQQRDQAQASLDKAVAIARAKGDSWTRIAGALGVTVQSAWERYRRVEEPHPPTS